MPGEYFSDRVRGSRPRCNEELAPEVWGGIVSMVAQGLNVPWFGKDFPEACEDGRGVCGCDEWAFRLALKAEIPDLQWPVRENSQPPTLVALDLLEFMFEHASSPTQIGYHKFLEHHHLGFDAEAGQIEMRDRINQRLARGGMAYELNLSGQIERLTSPVLEAQLAKRLSPTGDDKFDELLETAVSKFTNPDRRVRREALEQLWDAFERSKTMVKPGSKRDSAEKLVRVATKGTDPRERELLTEEMMQLTAIGNEFRIRHHETDRAEPSDQLVDQLFARMYALILRIHNSL